MIFFPVFDGKKNETTQHSLTTEPMQIPFIFFCIITNHSVSSLLAVRAGNHQCNFWVGTTYSLWKRSLTRFLQSAAGTAQFYYEHFCSVCQHSREAKSKVIILPGNLTTAGKRRVENVIWWKKDKKDCVLWILKKGQSQGESETVL